MSELLSRKELAARLKRSYRFVLDMERSGFQMISGVTTIESALSFLARNPPPSRIRQSKQKSQQ
jgi:hypothetical protein